MTSNEKRWPLVGILVIGAAAVSIAFLTLCDFDKTWMEPELPLSYLRHSLSTGSGLCVRDVGNALHYRDFDGAPRGRYLSTLVLIVNAKFRLWWNRHWLPHPSLSLTWLLTIFFVPFLMWRLVKRLGSDSRAAWLAVALLIASSGYLSGLTLLFHPAKPLAMFFLLVSLVLASGLDGRSRLRLAVLALTLFAGYFADETAWFALLALPLYFPGFFLGTPRGRLALCLLSLTFPAYLAVVSLQGAKSGFWHYALLDNHGLRELALPTVIANGRNLANSHFHLYASLPGRSFLCAFTLAFTAWAMLRLPAERRQTAAWTLLAAFVFVAFETLLLSRHLHEIQSDYYYGALFSPLLAVPLSLALARGIERHPRLGLVVFACLVATSLANFERLNANWSRFYNESYAAGLPAELRGMPKQRPLSAALVRRFWEKRDDPDFIVGHQGELPAKAYWLVEELRLMRQNGSR